MICTIVGVEELLVLRPLSAHFHHDAAHGRIVERSDRVICACDAADLCEPGANPVSSQAHIFVLTRTAEEVVRGHQGSNNADGEHDILVKLSEPSPASSIRHVNSVITERVANRLEKAAKVLPSCSRQ